MDRIEDAVICRLAYVRSFWYIFYGGHPPLRSASNTKVSDTTDGKLLLETSTMMLQGAVYDSISSSSWAQVQGLQFWVFIGTEVWFSHT